LKKKHFSSENYTKDMRSLMAQLPVWAGGRNHILFNHFCGTYPNYFDTDLGFDVGHAMVARASGRRQVFWIYDFPTT
jgi:hypothetical protein